MQSRSWSLDSNKTICLHFVAILPAVPLAKLFDENGEGQRIKLQNNQSVPLIFAGQSTGEGARECTRTVFGVLEVTSSYDEEYLLGHSIVNGSDANQRCVYARDTTFQIEGFFVILK